MKERFKKVTVVVKEKWDGFSKAVKIAVCAVPVALIAIIIILAVIVNHKSFTTLYSGLTTTEAAEISAVISDMGISDVKMNDKGDVIVPSDQVDNLRMKLSVQGYPKTSSDYSIWNDGIDLWSTESDKRVVATQQRETTIAATLRRLDTIRDAQVMLSIPQTRDYVITEKNEVPTCSVTIQLQEGEELTNAEVRAIFSLVSRAVDGLTYDNISVVDTKGRGYMWISPEDEAADEKDASGVAVGRRRMEFQRDITEALKKDLDEMFTKMYGPNGYAFNVAATLDFDEKRIVANEYFPLEGTDHGVLEQENKVETNTTLNNANGLVGTTPNADLSPDYPTFNGVADNQTYYYAKDQKQYDVTNIKTTTEKNGYKIESLTVGVTVNQATMTESERDMIQSVVAKAAGANVEDVAVAYKVFDVTGSSSWTDRNPGGTGVIISGVDRNRRLLIILVIVLGVVLIGLLIASLMMSRSRKKKIRRRQEQALAAAQVAALDNNYGTERPEMPQEVDFNIASLTEEAGKESRETILKREIAEFARSSPDIVASIIRNMIREESE